MSNRVKPAASELSTLLDALPSLVSYVDADERYRYTNRAYEDWFGVPAASLEGRSLREFLGDAAYAHLGPFVQRALAGERVRFEERVPYRVGGQRMVHIEYVPDVHEDGRIAGFFALVTDVSEQHALRDAAEQALRESEQRFRSFADDAPSMLWVTDTSGRCTFLSRGWYQYTGQTEDQGLDFGWLDAVHPEDREVARRLFLEANLQRVEFALEHRLRHADGTDRWVIDTGRPRYDEAGEFIGYIGSVVDIDAQKRIEQALREADRRKDVFLATLAHELRNPLAPLRNGLAVLKLAATSPDAAVQAREMMERQLSHMVRLIDDLLDVSRISSGKIALRRERVPVATLVAQALEVARPAFAEAGVELDVTDRAPGACVDGDAARLSQVLANLLHNAAKFTLRGGHVELAVTQGGGFVEVTVRDNGIGIPRDMLGRIFDLFSQVDQSIERSKGGLGIGLSLSRGLVELHGGTITASSAGLSRGSEFVVRLPAASAMHSPAVPAARPVDTAPRPLRVLVVDDNRDAAESLGMMLELLGHEPRVVVEAMAALEAADESTPDVVLLDLGMPGLSGYDVCRHLRSRPFGDRIRIVALTGWGAEDDKRRTREAGFDAHLVKPVDAETITRVLTSVAP